MKFRLILLITALLSFLAFGIFADVGYQPVYAGVKCSGTCHSCGPRATGDTRGCSCNDKDAEEKCCYDEKCNGHCSSDKNAPCGNCGCFCTPPACTCQNTSCPPSNPANKYRQTSKSTGSHRVCSGPNDCNPSNPACPVTYINTAPTCSMIPASFEMNRSDAPRAFTLRVTDKDWGDTVKITGYRVEKGGNLTSCVDVTTQSGGTLNQLVVRPGSSDPNALTKNTVLLADPSNAFGIYNAAGVCSGDIIVTLTDTSPESNNLDVPAHVDCKVGITVYNDKPRVTNIRVEDKDTNPTFRRTNLNTTDPDTDNLSTSFIVGKGNGSMPVGSLWDERRVARCTAPVDLSNNYGECSYWQPRATRTNPYSVSFSVSDLQGIEDIKDLAIWIQRSNKGSTPKFPLTTTTVRQSLQAYVGDLGNYPIGSGTYFTSAPCLGNLCSRDITDQLLYAFTPIRNKTNAANGSVSESIKQRSVYLDWLKVGFPNCLFRGTCSASNVPTASKTNASTDLNNWRNYDWTTAATSGKMLCLTTTDERENGTVINRTKTIPESTDGTCPSTCAACIALEKLEPNAANPTTKVDVSFMIWMNDTYINGGGDNAAGMEQGSYYIFVGASDKVASTPVGFGGQYWATVVDGKKANNTSTDKFVLNFDARPPEVTDFSLSLNTDTSIIASAKLTERTGESGVNGWANRFLIFEEAEDLDKPKAFMTKSGGTTFWNGTELASRTFPIRGPSTQGVNDKWTYSGHLLANVNFIGYGLDPATAYNVMGGFCAYDKAGNMCCVKSVVDSGYSLTESKKECANYETAPILQVRQPWIQTTLGSTYSNTSGSAFSFTISSDSRDITNQDARIPTSINQRDGVALGGMIVSGGAISGLAGSVKSLGYTTMSGSLGADARTPSGSKILNMYNLEELENRNWYGILYSLVNKNCALREDLPASERCIQASGTYVASYTELRQKMSQNVSGYFEVTSDIKIDSADPDILYCRGKHVIFVNAGVDLQLEQVVKQAAYSGNSGCMFVLDTGAKLTILNDDIKTIQNKYDRFDAAVVVSDGAFFETKNSKTILAANESDRLQVYGFLYSGNLSTPPDLGRNLKSTATTDFDQYYPAEWFVYDANILTVFRDLLGNNKSVNVVCGTSDHVLCQ